MNRFLLLVRVSRPAFWLVLSLISVVILFSSGGSFTWLALLNFILFPVFALMVFGVNDVYDYETDKLSKRKPSRAGGYLLSKEYHRFVMRSAVISAGILITASAFFSFFLSDLTNLFATLLLVFLAYTYSAPPVRLKERPIIDSLSNSLFMWAVFLIAFSHKGSLLDFPLIGYYAVLGIAPIHAMFAFADYSSDKKAGMTTIATFLGKRATAFISALIILVIILLSGLKNEALISFVWLIFFFCVACFFFPSETLARKLFSTVGLPALSLTLIIFLYQQFL
ncbi:UbiA family prenyltransferase [Candidatus Woesearchaeota archaeon]|nr:UbiA family prenyltransferase [Candidatus Woesearchaeota archaeon]